MSWYKVVKCAYFAKKNRITHMLKNPNKLNTWLEKRTKMKVQNSMNSSVKEFFSLLSHISPYPRPFIVNTNPKFFAVSQISFWQVGHEVCCVSCLLDWDLGPATVPTISAQHLKALCRLGPSRPVRVVIPQLGAQLSQSNDLKWVTWHKKTNKCFLCLEERDKV